MDSFEKYLWGLVVVLPILLFSVSFHESAHGLMAFWRGDDTAKRMGRITLDPFRHFDLWGSLLLPLFLIAFNMPVLAYAKPTPISVGKLRNPKRDFSLVALAGPLSNLLLAIFFALVAWACMQALRVPLPSLGLALSQGVEINLLLAFFNLLPLPTLDGLKCLYALLPDSWCWGLSRLEPYGIFIIYLVLSTGLLRLVLRPALFFLEFLNHLAGLG